MSKLVSAISSAVKGVVSSHGHGVHKVELHKDAEPFAITLAQRAPTEDKDKVHRGFCVCGAVGIELDRGELCNMQQICHCEECRQWHSAPMVTEFLFKPLNGVTRFYLVKGAEQLKYVETTKGQRRAICNECGTRVCNIAAKADLTATFPSMLPDFPLNVKHHVYYKEAVHKVHDGLPKYLDMPKEFGGSGDQAPTPW